MREDHRVDQADPVGQPARNLVRGGLQERDDGERRTQKRGLGAKTGVQPVRDHRVGHEAASQGVEGEQARQGCQRAEASERDARLRRFDAAAHEKGYGCRHDADRGVEAEVAGRRLGGRQCSRQPAGGIQQPRDECVAPERPVPIFCRGGLRQHCLLHRRERPEVDAGGAEHAGHAREHEQRRRCGERQVQAGHHHQEAAGRQGRPPADASGRPRRRQPGQ